MSTLSRNNNLVQRWLDDDDGFEVIGVSAQEDADTSCGVGVLVVQDGRFLCGTRLKDGSVGGPGGHIEAGSPRKIQPSAKRGMSLASRRKTSCR